jgi:chromosome segregation ATPase
MSVAAAAVIAPVLADTDPISAINNSVRELEASLNTQKNSVNLPAGQGRTRHWSTYVLLSGAALGVAYVVIGVVVTSPAIWVPGAIIVITNSIGAYYTKKFAMYKQLEDYLKILTQRLNSIKDTVLALKSDNKALSESAKELQDTIKKSGILDKKGAKELEDKAAQLNAATDKLKVQDDRLEKTLAESQAVKKQLTDLQAIFAMNRQQIDALTQKVTDLTQEVNALTQTKNDMEKDITELRTQNTQYKNNNELLQTSLKTSQGQFKQMKDVAQKHVEDPELDKTISQLTQGVHSTATSVADAQKAGTQLQSHRDALAQLLKEFDQK